MPLYSTSSRPKKAKKDGSNRASTASTVSTTSKTSKPSGDNSKKDTSQPQAAVHRGSVSSSGYPAKKQPTPTLAKSKDPEASPPNVFEYLDSESDSEITSSDDEGGYGHRRIAPNSQFKSVYPSGRLPTTAAQATIGRSRTSSVRSKDSTGLAQTPGAFDCSPVTAPLQLARQNINHRRPSSDGTFSIAGSVNEGSLPPEQRNMDLATLPEAFYPRNPGALHRHPLPPSPPRSPEEDLQHSGRKLRRNTKSSRPPSGYGLIAWRLSASAESKEQPRLPPLYRRFEDLNHRVLLYLQDEISQLEEELRILDDYEEMQRIGNAEQDGTKMAPASRRMDIQAQVYSSLHYRREEVMGALIQKTEQYNNALSAYSKVLQTLPRAGEGDADTYRTWMKDNGPIAAPETRFLDNTKDLLSLTPHLAGVGSRITPPVYSAIIIASAAIILPLLAFSMIAEFSGRILIVAVVGGAAAAIASHYSTGTEHLVKSQDGWRCATLYFVFMTVAALCIG